MEILYVSSVPVHSNIIKRRLAKKGVGYNLEAKVKYSVEITVVKYFLVVSELVQNMKKK